jgi:hypothetical protein
MAGSGIQGIQRVFESIMSGDAYRRNTENWTETPGPWMLDTDGELTWQSEHHEICWRDYETERSELSWLFVSKVDNPLENLPKNWTIS